MTELINNELCIELANHVDTLTHTGQKTLDDDVLKKLKNICKISSSYVQRAYQLLLYQLQANHAEVRFSAFQICNELFKRSHEFRQLLVSDLQQVMELTADTSPHHTLPSPRHAALALKSLALRSIHDWNAEFGHGYKKLQIGFNFLERCKKVDFNALEMEGRAERVRREERERRQMSIHAEKLKKITTEISELEPDINAAVTALRNCLGLLMPTPENFFVTGEATADEPSTSSFWGSKIPQTRDGSDSDTDSEEEIDLRKHGMLNSNYKIEVTLATGLSTIVKETEENAVILENARDQYQLVDNRYLPTVKRWIQVITKIAGSGESVQLKKLINLKRELEGAVSKYRELGIGDSRLKKGSSSDSEFEEVEEKEGYEETATEELVAMPSGEKNRCDKSRNTTGDAPDRDVWSREKDKEDPTTAEATCSSLVAAKVAKYGQQDGITEARKGEIISASDDGPKPSTSTGESSETSRKSKLLAVAPKLPFDIDLYHWEDHELKAPTMLSVKTEGSRFWAATNTDDLEEVPVPEGAASLRTRVIEFSGSFQPVKWACRAPLSSGKLCPRRDRCKCPFHGPIVARDTMGQCTNPSDAERLVKHEEDQCPDWQDPQLLAEIKEATGMDLKMPERRKKKGEKGKKKPAKDETQYPGLTDLKARQNTTRNRLSKKIFKKSVVKRVSEAMDSFDRKRFRDKFGDQFNYVHNTS